MPPYTGIYLVEKALKSGFRAIPDFIFVSEYFLESNVYFFDVLRALLLKL